MSEKKLSAMVPKNKPFQFEGLDVRPAFRPGENGAHIYSVNIMVTEEMWNRLKTIPRHRQISGILYWFDDEQELPTAVVDELSPVEQQTEKEAKPKRDKKPPKEKGSFGPYWQAMYRHGALNSMEIAESLGCEPGEKAVKAALKERLEVSSLTFVSPDQFENYCTAHHLTSLITISRQAEVEAKQ